MGAPPAVKAGAASPTFSRAVKQVQRVFVAGQFGTTYGLAEANIRLLNKLMCFLHCEPCETNWARRIKVLFLFFVLAWTTFMHNISLLVGRCFLFNLRRRMCVEMTPPFSLYQRPFTAVASMLLSELRSVVALEKYVAASYPPAGVRGLVIVGIRDNWTAAW